MNAQDRYEIFFREEGEKSVTYTDDTRVANTTIFTFHREDHTLGNLISQSLLRYDYVLFSAYKCPHPLVPDFELRVTTDGSKTPREAVKICCAQVIEELATFRSNFSKEVSLRKIANRNTD